MSTALAQFWSRMNSHGCLGSEINRWWVLWAITHPIVVFGFWTTLSEYEFIWLSGLGNNTKMGPVSYQTPFKLYTPFEQLWSSMTWYGFLGPETNRRWVVWAISTPSKFVCLLNTFETIRIHMFLGPDIIRTRVLWDIKHITNLYGFWTGLKQCEFIWVFGAQKWIEDGSCQLSHTLQICTACERLRNNQYEFICYSGLGNKSKMGVVS